MDPFLKPLNYLIAMDPFLRQRMVIWRLSKVPDSYNLGYARVPVFVPLRCVKTMPYSFIGPVSQSP